MVYPPCSFVISCGFRFARKVFGNEIHISENLEKSAVLILMAITRSFVDNDNSMLFPD